MFKYIIKPDLFKKIYNDKTHKTEFLQVDTANNNNHYYSEFNHRTCTCLPYETRIYKRQVTGHHYGYSRKFARIKIVYETIALEYEEIHQYLLTLKPKKKIFDFTNII